ncbi:uncharacterized protein LOC142222348 [Haematobia irritans]|uniref:uncharacterized protein LOC142222348 n=1 Tax=Haematobia irritans TaxID=7368 RepID=UPI003F50AE1E
MSENGMKLTVGQAEERKLCIEFLNMYRTMPSLWDTSSLEYHDRGLKIANYNTLLQKFREMEPMANLKDMKRKINTLRTNYRREVKRLKNCRLDEKEISQLYYFEALDFLRHSDHFKEPSPKRQKLNCSYPRYIETNPDFNTTSYKDESHDGLDEQSVDHDTNDSYKQPSVDYERNDVHKEELIDLRKPEVANQELDDDINRLGRLWVSKFRKMGERQQLWAEKFINEILLEGQLGNLHRHSIKIMENPGKS